MYCPQTLEALRNATSLPALESGVWPCVGRDGRTIDLFGLGHAPVNLSAQQAKAQGLMMSGTSGQAGIGSSSSAALQSSLENRLRAKTQILGSILYKLTWKEWTTPSGPSRFRLRASVARTSETGFTGWPTPTTRDYKDGQECKNVPLNALLGRVAWLAGWPTTRQADGEKNVRTLEGALREVERKGSPQDLCQAAQIAGWPTPTARDHFPAHAEAYIAAKKAQGHGMANLNDLAQQAATNQPARLTVAGIMLTGSAAGMGSGGQLNPAHSRWLMGLPPEWDACAPTETPSMLKRRKSGSKA